MKSCLKFGLMGLGLLVVIVIVVVVVFAVGVDSPPSSPASGGSAASGSADSTATRAGSAAKVVEPMTLPSFYVGDTVQVGKVAWTVLEALDHGNVLKSSNSFQDDAQTGGRFIEVKFQVVTSSLEGDTYAGVPLRDSKGRSFDPYDDRIWYLSEDLLCMFENLNPDVPRMCAEIYEVAADAEGLFFVATDLNPFMGGEVAIKLVRE